MQMKLSTLDRVQNISAEYAKTTRIAKLALNALVGGKLQVRLIDTNDVCKLSGQKDYDMTDAGLLCKLRVLIAEHYEAAATVHRETLFQLGVDPDA